MKRRLRIANKRRFVTVISALVFIAGMLVSSILMLSVSSAVEPALCREVIVQQGDTLWAIAREHSAASEDLRIKVHAIIDINGLDGARIHPGDKLQVPVTVEAEPVSLQASGY